MPWQIIFELSLVPVSGIGARYSHQVPVCSCFGKFTSFGVIERWSAANFDEYQTTFSHVGPNLSMQQKRPYEPYNDYTVVEVAIIVIVLRGYVPQNNLRKFSCGWIRQKWYKPILANGGES